MSVGKAKKSKKSVIISKKVLYFYKKYIYLCNLKSYIIQWEIFAIANNPNV